MKLGDLDTLREALGGKTPEGKLIVGKTYACALKQAAGFAGSRWFDTEAVIKWLKDNPGFKMTDVYPKKPKKKHKPTARVTPQPECSQTSHPA